MKNIRLYLFGPPHLEIDGRSRVIRVRKAMALLVYLVVTRQAHTRDALATLFWPESSQQTGRASLRRTLYRLNRAIGEGVLQVSGDLIGIQSQASLWVDVFAFEGYAGGSKDGVPNPSGAAEPSERMNMMEAANLYAGDFMAGFTLPDCPQFDEWQFFRREALQQQLKNILDRLAESNAADNRMQEAVKLSRRRMALDPLDEAAQRRLMTLYFQAGHKSAALRQYQSCAQILKTQLNMDPQPETQALYHRIRSASAAATSMGGDQRPETRYVRSGDVYIAYQVMGKGPVDVVFVSGFISHLEHIWNQPDLSNFHRKLAANSRLILFDKRGVGLSDRVGYPPTMAHTRTDIQTVMAAAGCKKAILFGVSEGGPAILTFARAHPDRVRGIVLYGTMAKGARSRDYPYALTNDQYDNWLETMLGAWGSPLGIEYFAPSRADDPALRQWWAQLLRLGSSPGSVRMVLEVLRDVDVRAILTDIRTPALILHRRDDSAIKAEAGRYLASRIPGARYVELPGQDHWWWIGDSDTIIDEIQRFTARL